MHKRVWGTAPRCQRVHALLDNFCYINFFDTLSRVCNYNIVETIGRIKILPIWPLFAKFWHAKIICQSECGTGLGCNMWAELSLFHVAMQNKQ